MINLNVDKIQPVFSSNYVTIAMSSSEAYVPYLAVCLNSLKEHTSSTCNYDIVVFTSEIKDKDKKILRSYIESKNISLRFFNPKKYFQYVKLHISHNYFKEECYYRIIAPLVFNHYDKLIFTDIDLIFNEDIQYLNNVKMNGKPLLAAIDLVWHGIINQRPDLKEQYCKEVLKIEDPYQYVNTGVLVFDIQHFDWKKYISKLFVLINNNKFETQEQCAINSLFYGNIEFLDYSWNTATKTHWITDLLSAMPPKTKEIYLASWQCPKIIHYLGGNKPWHDPDEDKANIWWQYAKETPYYKIIKNRLYNTCKYRWYQYLFSIKKFYSYKIIMILGFKIVINQHDEK